MDERVKGEYRQIYSELLSIILVFTAVSLLVKFFLFDAAVSECVTEFVILVFSPVYLAVRQFMARISCGVGRPGRPDRRRRMGEFPDLYRFLYLGILCVGKAWETFLGKEGEAV